MALPDSILSPAKINLMLRVTGRRPDGYHNLQTCFELLNWGDTLHFTALDSSDIIIEGDFGDLPQADNLMDKAARLLQPLAQNSQGVRITVDKRIPQGAGLGGGSSNAAMTLTVLNQFWQCDVDTKALLRMGLALGADVPVFLFGRSAVATGVGEQLQAFDFIPKFYVLFMPNCSISTAQVFSDPKLKRDREMVGFDHLQDTTTWVNDCLPVVLDNFPEMRALYDRLSMNDTVYLSGTGSTFFAAFDSYEEAQVSAQRASNWCQRVHIAEPLKEKIFN